MTISGENKKNESVKKNKEIVHLENSQNGGRKIDQEEIVATNNQLESNEDFLDEDSIEI